MSLSMASNTRSHRHYDVSHRHYERIMLHDLYFLEKAQCIWARVHYVPVYNNAVMITHLVGSLKFKKKIM